MEYKVCDDLPLTVASARQSFGRGWTSLKLEAVMSYLMAYLKVMSKQSFFVIYIDAFAGSGYIQQGKADVGQLVFPELADESAERFIEGSAIRVLQVDPGFNQYLFIEKCPSYAKKLNEEIARFPEKQNLIKIHQGDANEMLSRFCKSGGWQSSRAVLFLDPYGMQVKWETLKVIAQTKAIDVWYLFPLFAVNRLLKKDGSIDANHRKLLNDIFGTEAWEAEFYKPSSQGNLFDTGTTVTKKANFDSIEEFFLNRLRTIFPSVAPKAGRLLNSKGSALFSLCFAASNPKGGEIAVRIANDLIRKI